MDVKDNNLDFHPDSYAKQYENDENFSHLTTSLSFTSTLLNERHPNEVINDIDETHQPRKETNLSAIEK
jgi:hypothetical protein